jgi:predicted O-linked N-acetylglucosamine transferase (SPINDLY family)
VQGGVFPWHRYAEAGNLTREALGVPGDAFVCGAFVSLMKLSPRCLQLWRRILERIPQALLAFSPPAADWHRSYLHWLRAHGIDQSRVVFIPHHKDESMALARYKTLDVALDPMPCGNVNGTMEALAMGVPVVTLAGVRHGERLGNALLQRFGITDSIAGDEDEYLELVDRLACDPEWAANLRQRIRAASASSPAWNSESLVRNLESTFFAMLAERETATAQ